MLRGQRTRRLLSGGSVLLRRAPIAGLTAAAGLTILAIVQADAGQLPASAFQTYNAANASSIVAGPFSLFTVSVDQLQPTQMNEGFTEVDKKATGFDLVQPSQLNSAANLLSDIEPVVIGPGGILYLTDGHHTFTALEDSAYGASDPTVYVNVIANFSNLTTAQFWAAMQADDFLLPLNDGVPQVVNLNTGVPIPTNLQALTEDPYRGLEYSILKNKNSKLFTTTNNIAGVVGSAIPGVDKETGLYADFINADAYRNANGGLGLPYLSPGDVQIATQWNLNPNSVTSEPNVGTIKVGQLPGFILNGNIVINGTISNATLANGTLDGTETGTFNESTTFASFNGMTQFNLGTPSNPILVGQAQSGFVMQLGNDAGFSVTLSGNNTYTGGTTITAGDLIIASDASLGAAPSLSNSAFNASLTLNAAGFPTNVIKAVEADNGIIFNSLTEGNGTLTIGTTAGGGTQTFTTNRPIAIDSETATINVNGYIVTLGGPLLSAGTDDVALGNATGESDLTIDDNSANKGKLILSTASPDFFGNIIIGNTNAPTVEVMSDAALGATNLPANELGEIELNGGTFQAGASFSSLRTVFLGGGSTFDTNGFSTSFAGGLQDTQRTLAVINSSSNAGSVTFGNFQISSTATLNVNAGSGSGGGPGNLVTFTNGIVRAPGATLILQPTTSGNLGTLASGSANSEDVFDTSTGPGASSTVTNGIVAPWIVVYAGIPSNQTPNSPYSFATYGANGFTATAGNSTNILTSTSTSVVQQSANATLAANTAAYALSVQNATTVNLGGNTLTLGNGSTPAGLILNGGATISNGTLAFGGSEGVIWIGGQSNNTNTISAEITGSGGLTFAGGLHATDLGISKSSGLSVVTISTPSTETGQIIIDSGAVTLTAANVFSSSEFGVFLEDTKTSPSPATLNIKANNEFSVLSSAGNNSSVNISSGAALTIGDGTNQNSTLSSTVTETGAAVAGVLTKNGTGLLDISGASVSLISGSTVLVNGGALRIGNGVFGASATNVITVASGAELQYSGNFGSKFNDPIQGAGLFHLVGGTVQLTSTSNTYAGGTVIEVGATLDVTTANLPTNTKVTNAGGTLLFDQSTNGTFTGVMTDGQQSGGPNNPNDMSCTLVSCNTGMLSGTLIKDDSTTGSGGNVTIANQQSYSGMTYIEAGTLTLGAVNTIASSEGVILGRVGGAVCNPSPCSGPNAILALGADNTIAGLADDPANTTQVQLNGHTLTLAPTTGTFWNYAGSIIDNGASGNLVQNGPGISILTGTNTYTGTTTIEAGILEVNGSITSSSSVSVDSGGTLTGDGTVDPPTVTIFSNGTFAPGLPGTPGTSMTIAGNLAFQSGAIYQLQIGPAASSFANVTGTASLAGVVQGILSAGSYTKTNYTILQSTGLSGTFGGGYTSLNAPGFTGTLSYGQDDAFLTLVASLGAGGGLNGNQRAVANTINSVFNSGGTLPAAFFPLFTMTGSTLATSLSQVDGETATDSERASFQMMTEFLGLMLDPYVDGRSGTAGGAMGFSPDQQASLPPDIALAYASVFKAPPKPTFSQRWTAWGAAFGGSNQTNGDPAVGSNTVTTSTYGFAAGLDYHYSPDTVLGFALAGGGTNWDLVQSLGTGRSDTFQAGLYGVTHFGPAYLAAALAFGNNWFTTNRTAALGDQLTAKLDGQNYGARVEGGYRFVLPVSGSVVGVTPYAALQSQDFHTPSYAETDLSGGGFGLSYNAMNGTDTRSELGGRFDNPTLLNGRPLILRAQVAWAHDWATGPALNAAFESLPGSGFTVNGAPIPKNSALTSEAAEWWLDANWSLTAKFNGEFASGSQTYAGSGTLRYSW